jgi:hypothetical protein
MNIEKIINRKKYNTKTATLVAKWDNGRGRSDFNGVEENLYRSPKGQYFIAYWGGAASKYAKSSGQYMSESSGIILLTESEAFSWLIQKDHDEIAEELFPHMIEEG